MGHFLDLIGISVEIITKLCQGLQYHKPWSNDPYELIGGGFRYLLFSTLPGEMIQFEKHIFQMGWINHQLVLWLVELVIPFADSINSTIYLGYGPLPVTVTNKGL